MYGLDFSVERILVTEGVLGAAFHETLRHQSRCSMGDRAAREDGTFSRDPTGVLKGPDDLDTQEPLGMCTHQ